MLGFQNETEKLREAWALRSKEFDCVQLSWVESVKIKKESMSTVSRDGRAIRVPPVDREFTGLQRRISLHGEMMRLETQSLFVGEPMEFLDYVMAHNGERCRGLAANSRPSEQFGSMRGTNYGAEHRAASFTIKLFFRPLNPKFGCHSDPIVESVGDDGTYVVESGRHKVFVDPEKDFLPTKIERKTSSGKMMKMIDVDHTFESGRWMPAGWKMVTLDHYSDEVVRSHLSTVTSVTTHETKKADFDLVFPRGTCVNDTGSPDEKISLGDGKFRPILREERRKKLSIEELLNSEPGELI